MRDFALEQRNLNPIIACRLQALEQGDMFVDDMRCPQQQVEAEFHMGALQWPAAPYARRFESPRIVQFRRSF
jgi:hypothetical protein